ncbi:EexN family lipoprotein [Pasteurella atlantica]|uniref:EexN family lipoprotein n=1 Tax=Phocoenobacter atlanticus TaxID=3416742 RepID=UPI002763CED3|nr:EexN family lipoprotein [Pasteurella atlantica]MDP8042535.1 EexN family lipoprotein [Pasteurella atlantica]
MKKVIFILISIFLLNACGEKIYTVDDFSKDDKLLKTYHQKCKNGELNWENLNCKNMQKARVKKGIRLENAWE